MTPFLIPYTICHELAHQKGYRKEGDAGFIAFMASINSPSKVFQYSGLFHGLVFTLNALKHEVSAEEFNRIYQKLTEPVRIQLSCIKEQNQANAFLFTELAGKFNNLSDQRSPYPEETAAYGFEGIIFRHSKII